VGGLHAQSDNIDWDEDCNLAQDAPPADGSHRVCSPAWASRKTVAIKAFSKESCKKKDQGRRLLTAAPSPPSCTRTSDLGFVNYQNSSGPISDAKIVVCLDSLYRVVTGH
jgi:hypothetical protein